MGMRAQDVELTPMSTDSSAPNSNARTPRANKNTLVAVCLIAAVSAGLGFVVRGCFTSPTAPASPAASEEAAPESNEAQVWTCSMHPQIRLPEFGLCPICAMDLIPVSAGNDAGDGMAMRTFTTSEAAAKLMQVATSPVERRFVTKEVRMVGKIDYDETKLGYITAWVPGRLDRLYVDYTGIRVEKGDHMVYLYSPEILTAQEELRRAATAAANMRQDAPEVLKQTARTTLEAARNKLRRWGLTDEQIAEAESQGTVSDHITIYAPMGGTVIERMGQEGMYVETGTKIYTIADLNEVWVMLDAYESDLPWLHYGQNVEFTTEAYPGEVFSGVIAFIDPILDEMTRTVKVRVNVPNPDGRLKPEMFVRATVRSNIATGGRVMDPGLAGKWISPMHPEIVKEGPGSCDICGMALVPAEKLGYVPAEANEEDMPLAIPASAALLTGKRAVVYVEVPETEKPTYEGREVLLGARAGDYYIVRSGLSEGELVVTNGNFKIDSALQIHAKPSMMTPDGGAVVHAEEGPPLPFILVEQLDAVNGAYVAVRESVDAAEHDVTDSALIALEESVANVDMTLFPPKAHSVWMEYSMRLKNDIIALRDATSPDDRSDAEQRMSDTVSQLRHQLALPAGGADADSPQAPAEFRNPLAGVLKDYFAVQTALAGDDLDAATAAAKNAASALASIESEALPEPLLTQWTGTDAVALKTAVDRLVSSADMDAFRVAFEPFSEALTAVLRTYGMPDGENAYVVHCPMAFEFEGADWLQASSDEVLNPYFGSEMLNCGEVTGRIGGASTAEDAAHDHAAHEGSAHE
ncbi:MAG: efflux RND transporter periplasmic adaptor subunit [Candidatus Hydrogenedentes bacterium]|nr:efflux RND transporter periplasmic adaptor subunit [Candidatus Hydrogenedentota bacterium]